MPTIKEREDITPELLRQLLRYEPETGKLYWQERQSGKIGEFTCSRKNIKKIEREAGSVYQPKNGGARRAVKIKGYKFYSARLAWAIYYGKWPDAEIDHINHNTLDNRIENLRDVSRIENLQNFPLRKDNTSGHVGIYYKKSRNAWEAYCQINGKRKFVGYSKNKDTLIEITKNLRTNLGFHQNHGV